MLRTLGIVLADDVSGIPSCSPIDFAGRQLGGRPVIEWTVRRLTESQRLDGVIVVVPDTEQGKKLSALVPADLPVHHYKQGDRLEAAVSACKTYSSEAVVIVSASSPFLDPALIDRLIISAEKDTHCDYASYSDSAQPAFSRCLVAEWVKTSALCHVHAETIDQKAPRGIGTQILANPKYYATRLISLPAALESNDLCLSLIDEEDWDQAEAIYEFLEPDQLDWQETTRLQDHSPVLQDIPCRLPAR